VAQSWSIMSEQLFRYQKLSMLALNGAVNV
jgi:hypothetical protein